MGKGKKKGGKKDVEEDAPSTKSTSEEPSTSTQAAEPEDDGGLGLGLGGARKKKQKPKSAEETPVNMPPEPTPAPDPKPQPESKTEEVTEEFEGLGLGGGGKRKPRKKKKGDAVQSIGEAQQPVAITPAATPQPVVSVPPSQSDPQIAHGTQPAQQVRPSPSMPQASWSQPAVGQGRGQHGIGRGQHGAGRGQPGVGRGYPGEVPHGAARGPPTAGKGRPQQQQPTPQPTPQPTSQAAIAPYPQDAVLCRYKVPKKIPQATLRLRTLEILTNYLPMKIKAMKISRYDVTFKPDKPKKLIPHAFKMVKNKFYPNEVIAFDQMKNCYSLNALKNVPANDRFCTQVEVKDQNGKILRFEVSLKATGIVDLGKILSYMSSGGTSLNPPTEEIQCVDVILRQGTLEAYIKAGRQYFQRPDNPIDLGDGLEMWTGLFQSAIFTSRPFINIDVAHKGFPRNQRLVDALRKDFRLDPNRSIEQQRGRDAENFLSFIKGLRVVTTLVGNAESAGQKREFIINGLVNSPMNMTFLLSDKKTGADRKITVAEYFAKEKQFRIQYPNLNCVWVGPRDKNIYFPMELLEVSYGQAINRQLNENQLSKMVREAATPPDERLRKITQVKTHMNYSRNEQFKKFGLEIDENFFAVQAKILDPPNLEVGEGRIIPRNGQWQANRLLKPEALQSWGFLAIETDPRCDHNNVINLIMSAGRSLGMAVSDPKMCRFNVRLTDLHSALFFALENEIKFLFIIVATKGRDYYHKVKQMAERDVGILTQCIKEFTASRKMNQATAKNILLKVNSKLMGINQALDSRSMPRCLQGGGVMIVGADVTHPSPEQTSVPSIAAVTASIDPRCYMYNIELSIQTPKKEMIVEFEDMMVDHMKVYKKHQNSLPRKIFVFRDGVSEGQFAQVMNSELQAVHNAYRRMAGPNAKPEILFLLVQKRHHTRFFQPRNSRYNVEPGTVVDRDIVHASELDFYLVSHQAIKGTARPTRYHAICNDGKIPDDEVEQLTYYLCHLYSRCMRAVSYPTPTYYAHLACLRARSLTFGEKFDNNELERKPKRLHVLDKMLQYSRMFFV